MHATEAPAVNTIPSLGDMCSKDDLLHLFCHEQQHWSDSPDNVATSRCGKTKSGWNSGSGKDVLCTVCLEMYQSSSCAHCTRGGES